MAQGQIVIPWERIGTKLDDCYSVEDALVRCQTDYEVAMAPALMRAPDASGRKQTVELPHASITYRTDTLAPFNVVRSRYELLQNADAFALLDVLIQRGELGLVAGGEFRNGMTAWLCGKFGQTVIKRLDGKDDPLDQYIILTTSHDGERPRTAFYSSLRLWCSNQIPALIAGMRGGNFGTAASRIKHEAGIVDKVQDADNLVLEAREAFMHSQEFMQTLAEIKMSRAAFKEFAGDLLEVVDGPLDMTAEDEENAVRRRNRERKIATLEDYFTDKEMGNTGESLWDGFNGITQWVDHKVDRLNDAAQTRDRFLQHEEGTMFGENARVKRVAMKLLRQRAGLK